MDASVGNVSLDTHPLSEPFEIDDPLAWDFPGEQELAAFGHVVGTQADLIPSWRLSHTFAIAATSSGFRSI